MRRGDRRGWRGSLSPSGRPLSISPSRMRSGSIAPNRITASVTTSCAQPPASLLSSCSESRLESGSTTAMPARPLALAGA